MANVKEVLKDRIERKLDVVIATACEVTKTQFTTDVCKMLSTIEDAMHIDLLNLDEYSELMLLVVEKSSLAMPNINFVEELL